MRNSNDQAECFALLAKVFLYLASGKSHVSYLLNNLGNAFVWDPQMVLFLIILKIMVDEIGV
jgi:hypothetical protein